MNIKSKMYFYKATKNITMQEASKVSKVLEKFEKASDGLQIYYKAWLVKQPKAIIGIVHGLGEHCNRYQYFIDYFNQNGIAVVGFDHRGHGQSEGQRGHAPDLQNLYQSIDQLFVWASELAPNIPQIIYGHSMGGNLALNYCLNQQRTFKGVITTGPMIRLPKPPPAALMIFARLMNKLYPTYSQSNQLDPNLVTVDPEEAQRYINDPMVHDQISARMAILTLDAAKYLDDFNATFPLPLLMMHGELDQFTAPQGTIDFAKRVKGNIELKTYPGLRHEIHNEKERNEVFEHMLTWLNGLI